jgi:hypothetical protein
MKTKAQNPPRIQVMDPSTYVDDPALVSTVNGAISRMVHELRLLEHLAAARPLPGNLQSFVTCLRKVTDELMKQIHSSHARSSNEKR